MMMHDLRPPTRDLSSALGVRQNLLDQIAILKQRMAAADADERAELQRVLLELERVFDLGGGDNQAPSPRPLSPEPMAPGLRPSSPGPLPKPNKSPQTGAGPAPVTRPNSPPIVPPASYFLSSTYSPPATSPTPPSFLTTSYAPLSCPHDTCVTNPRPRFGSEAVLSEHTLLPHAECAAACPVPDCLGKQMSALDTSSSSSGSGRPSSPPPADPASHYVQLKHRPSPADAHKTVLMTSPFPFARPKVQAAGPAPAERPSSPPLAAVRPSSPPVAPSKALSPAPSKPEPPTTASIVPPTAVTNVIFVHLVLNACPEIPNLHKPFEKVLRLAPTCTLAQVIDSFLPELAQFGLSRYDESLFALLLPSLLKTSRKATEREKEKVKAEKANPHLAHTLRLSELPANLSHGVPELALCVQPSPELLRLHHSSSRFGEEDTIDWVLDSPSPYLPSAASLATSPGPGPFPLKAASPLPTELTSNPSVDSLFASILTHPLFVTCTSEQLPTVLSARPAGEMVLRLSDRSKDAAAVSFLRHGEVTSILVKVTPNGLLPSGSDDGELFPTVDALLTALRQRLAAEKKRGKATRGWLVKEAAKRGNSKRRWFEHRPPDGQLLFYYKQPGDEKPIGTIELNGAVIRALPVSTLTFEIRSRQRAEPYVLHAPEPVTCDLWVSRLTGAQPRPNAPVAPRPHKASPAPMLSSSPAAAPALSVSPGPRAASPVNWAVRPSSPQPPAAAPSHPTPVLQAAGSVPAPSPHPSPTTTSTVLSAPPSAPPPMRRSSPPPTLQALQSAAALLPAALPSPAPASPLCSNCDVEAATSECTTCAVYLCLDCRLSTHRSRIFLNHEFVDL